MSGVSNRLGLIIEQIEIERKMSKVVSIDNRLNSPGILNNNEFQVI